MSKKLKGKKTKGRVKVLRATLYKNQKVIIRMIGDDYFEYLISFNGEIYSSYIIIQAKNNNAKLTKPEIDECAALIYTGAEATLDTLLGVTIDNQTKEYVELFEKHRETLDNK
jgi:hypothetical protein